MSVYPETENILKTLSNCMDKIRILKTDKPKSIIIDSVDNILTEVSSILSFVESKARKDEVFPDYAEKLCENALISLELVRKLQTEDKKDDALLKLRCESLSILKMLFREIDFFYNTETDEEGLRTYFKQQDENLKKLYSTEKADPEGEYPYEVSIVVLFYNNKDMTKACIDSILKYSGNYSYELITVNNGSDDETTSWSDSLPHKKKINLKYNIGSSRGGTIAVLPEIADGRFTVFLANDVIVTKNWLTSLLECIKSDPRIAFASPVYNSCSNRQTIPVDYNTIEEMQSFAENYNKPNPSIWEDRARLFGIAMIFRPWVFEKIGGFVDLYFSYNMFADDDMCVKLNHAGYRMVLCRDTFVHHHGSATIKDSQFEVMEKGRRQFFEKNGYDSWSALGDKFIYFESMLGFIKSGPVKILAVNPLYGEEFLMLKNALRKSNITEVSIDVLNMDERFKWSLENIADRVFYGNYYSQLINSVRDSKYNVIMLCQEAADFPEFEAFLRDSANLLDESGKILLLLNNIYFKNNLYKILTKQKLSDEYDVQIERKAFITLGSLLSFADTLGLQEADLIRVGAYCQKNEVIDQVLSKVLQLGNGENDICYNTAYYNIGFVRK